MAILRWIITIVIVISCIVALFLVFFYRERFMFLPSSEFFDISGGKWVEIDSHISGYHIQNNLSQKDTLILYSHGNGGNLTWHSYSRVAYLLKDFGDVLMYDYPGYGRSKGTCTEKEVLNSGLVAYDYAVNLGYKNIVCYGFSMGGSVSINIASQRSPSEIKFQKDQRIVLSKQSPNGLILQSTFSRISDCVPVIGDFALGNFFRSIENANAIKCPVVILHSLKDGVVPYDSSKELYDSVITRKKFIDIEGDHNSAVLNKEIFSEVFDFLEH